MSVLETHDLTKEFAGFRAVDRVSIALDDGRVHALVGPNGAGKTTLFHMLTGFVKPTSGMSLEDVQRTIQLIKKIREGRTVLLVEHNMGVVGELADRVVVMQQGRIIADGAYDDVRREPAVVAAYLGETDA